MASSSLKSTVARLTGTSYESIAELKFVKISDKDQKTVTDFLNAKEARTIKGDIKMLKHVRISKEEQQKVKEVMGGKKKEPEKRNK